MPHFSRADAQSAARTFAKIFADGKSRREALEILAASIQAAHAIDGAMWGVTLDARAVRLNVGRGAALGFSTRELVFALDGRVLDDEACQILAREAKVESGFSGLAPHASRASFEATKLGDLWPLIAGAHLEFVRQAARGFESRAPRPTTIRDAHSSGVLELLRAELGQPIPDPAYVPAAPPAPLPEGVFDAAQWLAESMQGAGLSFPAAHLAAFFTALSVKGLVILSGPSGTGKTALALRFAALFPSPDSDLGGAIPLEKAHLEDGLPLPESALRYLSVPRVGESRAANLVCEGAAFPAQIVGTAAGARLQLRGAARKWCAAHLGESFALESDFEDDSGAAFRLLRPLRAAGEAAANHLFLPVRPDWRDEKPLLGYFNPLANRYEWTPFLRFLLRADAGFARGDGLAYFVVLDEMNLARAEWYFADFLALLEAGRDQSGRTREPLRLDFDARATGELPPRELHLPPNLYFIGTINADESAPALSPKVLDRAWVLDAPRADFRAYSAQNSADSGASDSHQRKLLALFTRENRFAVPDKSLVAAQLAAHPARREDLASLSDALEPFGAGFGFRVFDEILLFCALGEKNGLFEREAAAFDCAVSLKIASRFRGARGALDEALRAFLGWSEARDLKQSADAAKKLLARLDRDGFLA